MQKFLTLISGSDSAAARAAAILRAVAHRPADALTFAAFAAILTASAALGVAVLDGAL